MTPDEQHRLRAVEAETATLRGEVRSLGIALKDANRKLDQLVTAANMGKGAWWLTLRLGGTLVGIAMLGAALSSIWSSWHR